jgi:hypothetical protein
MAWRLPMSASKGTRRLEIYDIQVDTSCQFSLCTAPAPEDCRGGKKAEPFDAAHNIRKRC